MKDLFSLTGRVAIVTGAGQGIGKAISLGLADYGADVVVAGRNPERLTATAKEIRGKGRRALEATTDVRNSQQIDRMVECTLEEYKRIDVLVNNAGGNPSRFGSILELTEEGWDSEFELNAKSCFLCSKAVAKVMIAQKTKGNIINLSSIAGFSNREDMIAYGAAKAAVRSFTDGLAKALAPHGIRVNGIAPSHFATPGPAGLYADPEFREQRAKKMVPLGRLADPSEIVGLAVYLASDASSYLTGQTILISGGLDTLLLPKT